MQAYLLYLNLTDYLINESPIQDVFSLCYKKKVKKFYEIKALERKLFPLSHSLCSPVRLILHEGRIYAHDNRFAVQGV